MTDAPDNSFYDTEPTQLADFLRAEKDGTPWEKTSTQGMLLPGSISGYNNSYVPHDGGQLFMKPYNAFMDMWSGATPQYESDGQGGVRISSKAMEGANEIAGAAMTGGIAMPKPAGAIGIFGSKPYSAAHAAERDAAAAALDAGRSAGDVWKTYGWARAPDDGTMYWEQPASSLKIKQPIGDVINRTTQFVTKEGNQAEARFPNAPDVKLGDVVGLGKLEKAYPDLGNVSVWHHANAPPGHVAAATPPSINQGLAQERAPFGLMYLTRELSAQPATIQRRTIGHEIQHLIDDDIGNSIGSHLGHAQRYLDQGAPNITRVYNEIKGLLQKQYPKESQDPKWLDNAALFNTYKRNRGEMLAFEGEDRDLWPAWKRRAVPPRLGGDLMWTEKNP